MTDRNKRTTATAGYAGLVADARAAGTPAAVAAEAARITANRFGAERGARPGARASAYYWGVVRRRALAGAAPRITRSLVIASLALELSDAGHSPEAIRREIVRLHGSDAAAEALCPVPRGGQAA